MNRILILGISGAGKSTLAKHLRDKLNFPTHFLDVLFWQPGWQFPSSETWATTINTISNGEKWIIEGNYESALEVLIPKADTIILFEIPRITAIYRIIKRSILYRHKSREDRPRGCPERVDWEFLKYIWHFPRDRKPGIDAAIQNSTTRATKIVLRTPADLESFYQSL